MQSKRPRDLAGPNDNIAQCTDNPRKKPGENALNGPGGKMAGVGGARLLSKKKANPDFGASETGIRPFARINLDARRSRRRADQGVGYSVPWE